MRATRYWHTTIVPMQDGSVTAPLVLPGEQPVPVFTHVSPASTQDASPY
jgi:hypothetical protein